MDIVTVIIIPIVLIFVGWVIHRILDRAFSKARNNERLIEIYESRFKDQDRSYIERLDEKDREIETIVEERKTQQKESRRVLESLKRSGLSAEKLVQKYDKPLSAVLISYATQREPTSTGYYKECKFVREELVNNYDAKGLGGSDYLIPPARVPRWIKNNNDLQQWFEKEILKEGRFCKLKFLILFDLRNKAYWKNYLPFPQKAPMHFTLGEALQIEDIFTEEQIRRIALGDIIRDGDIAWLASSVLSGNELNVIHKNQALIEEKLSNPSLRTLSDESNMNDLTMILKELEIAKPSEVAKAIVNEAQFWVSRLK